MTEANQPSPVPSNLSADLNRALLLAAPPTRLRSAAAITAIADQLIAHRRNNPDSLRSRATADVADQLLIALSTNRSDDWAKVLIRVHILALISNSLPEDDCGEC